MQASRVFAIAIEWLAAGFKEDETSVEATNYSTCSDPDQLWFDNNRFLLPPRSSAQFAISGQTRRLGTFEINSLTREGEFNTSICKCSHDREIDRLLRVQCNGVIP